MMQTINLTQNNFKMPPVVYMVQNDTGRELKMILDDVTLDGTETGAVAIKRSDGSYYTIAATIDATNNAFDADMTQALTQPSRTECQLKVTASDDTVISTYTFIIMVQPSTDGLSEEQLGINPQDLIDAAAQLTLSDNDVKLALLQIAEKVVYTDEHGQDYYDALEDALYPPVRATSVTLDKNSLGFTGVGGTDTLMATVSPNNVEDDTVYWGSSDKDVAVVSDGIVTATGLGTCTITATCNTKHASASVTVATATLVSISASYTQSGTIYDNGSLDDILTEGTLVVTATWSDSSTSTVDNADVTLSGSLTIGTSTITVSYGGESDTISVTVTDSSVPISTVPMSFYSTGYLHWDNATQTGSLSHNYTSAIWDGLILNGLQYTYGSVKNKTLTISYDVTLSGVVSSNSGSGFLSTLGAYTVANPQNNSAQRKASTTVYTINDSGTFHVSESVDLSTAFPSGNDSYYLGFSFFINKQGNITVSFSNLSLKVSA